MSAAFLDELQLRGLIADVTDRAGLAELLAKGSVALYAGYDPTSSSLHVGNLVPTILLKRFQLAGHGCNVEALKSVTSVVLTNWKSGLINQKMVDI